MRPVEEQLFASLLKSRPNILDGASWVPGLDTLPVSDSLMHENGANYHQAKVKVRKPPQPFFVALLLAIIIFQGVEASEHHRRSHI